MRQQLSPQARRDKAARDKAYAMSPARKAKKAHAQRERRKNPSAAKNKDFDHQIGNLTNIYAKDINNICAHLPFFAPL